MATYPINLFGSRVKDTSTTTGTGVLTLANSAPTLFVTFGSRFALTQRFGYAIIHDSANEWEDGIGYLSASTTLVRERPLHGSSGDYTLVSFSAGNKTVFCTIPGEFISAVDTRGRALAVMAGLAMP